MIIINIYSYFLRKS